MRPRSDFGECIVEHFGLAYRFQALRARVPLNAVQKAPARQMQYWESFVRHGVPRAEGQPAMAGSAMAGRPGVVLSLNSAAEGGNTLGASVHREHQRHLGDTAGSG